MINTIEIKRARDEVFTLPSAGTPESIILIVGSCRCVAYLNYLKRYNDAHGYPLRVHYIEPNDYCVDFHGGGLNDLGGAETNPRVLEAIRSATIFIHEFYQSYGMFNSDRAMDKHIYQFGMRAPIDLSIPNFHDRFILFSEQRQFTPGLSLPEMMARGLDAVRGFRNVCERSSFPEFSEHFRDTWRRLRYFWTGNHVSRHFHLYLFRQMNDRFLHLPLDNAFWEGAGTEDLFSNTPAPVTQEDVDAYGLTWDQAESPIVPLKI